jgi:ferric-chelate reductase
VWPCWVLWGFDRLLKAFRVFFFNRGYFIPGRSPTSLNATAERVAGGFVRLCVRRPAHLHWAPGQSAFLTIPSISAHPFESHPFTIASADIPAEKGIGASDLVFVIKARKGFTGRLEKAAASGESFRLCFDGPYGQPARLAYYDTVILVAGSLEANAGSNHMELILLPS